MSAAEDFVGRRPMRRRRHQPKMFRKQRYDRQTRSFPRHGHSWPDRKAARIARCADRSEAASALRGAGVTRPIVFLSSNTNEYLTEGRLLKPKIAVEFGAIKLGYAPNMSAAKYALGL